MTVEARVEVQAIACLACGASDCVRSDDERAVRWPAWEAGPHFGFCPSCGGDAWAAEPISIEDFEAMEAGR